MTLDRSGEPLLGYTDWLRAQWQGYFQDDPQLLELEVGEHADGRFGTVGQVVRHIFGAELRYADRVAGRPVTDVAGVDSTSAEALFDLGARSRAATRRLLSSTSDAEWDEHRTFEIGNFDFEGTAWKIFVHVLVHEIRHWAQLGTLLRRAGKPRPLHDFLVSPVLGGTFGRRAQ